MKRNVAVPLEISSSEMIRVWFSRASLFGAGNCYLGCGIRVSARTLLRPVVVSSRPVSRRMALAASRATARGPVDGGAGYATKVATCMAIAVFVIGMRNVVARGPARPINMAMSVRPRSGRGEISWSPTPRGGRTVA